MNKVKFKVVYLVLLYLHGLWLVIFQTTSIANFALFFGSVFSPNSGHGC
jgi:hypothetical protein